MHNSCTKCIIHALTNYNTDNQYMSELYLYWKEPLRSFHGLLNITCIVTQHKIWWAIVFIFQFIWWAMVFIFQFIKTLAKMVVRGLMLSLLSLPTKLHIQFSNTPTQSLYMYAYNKLAISRGPTYLTKVMLSTTQLVFDVHSTSGATTKGPLQYCYITTTLHCVPQTVRSTLYHNHLQ